MASSQSRTTFNKMAASCVKIVHVWSPCSQVRKEFKDNFHIAGGCALEDFLKTGDQYVTACVFSFQNLKREAIFFKPGDKV
jgi:hypothetical protein